MAYLMVPERIFSFPRTAPDQFLLVISLCPFLSVLGQEIAYRLLFFERYGDLITRTGQSRPSRARWCSPSHMRSIGTG